MEKWKGLGLFLIYKESWFTRESFLKEIFKVKENYKIFLIKKTRMNGGFMREISMRIKKMGLVLRFMKMEINIKDNLLMIKRKDLGSYKARIN